MSWETEYERWLENADDSLQAELKAMDEASREDAFYQDLAFGTGGLRGILGSGTNRMNTHVVGKASQGLSDYLNGSGIAPSVVIGYDSRINSELFARTSAGVFAANGIRVWIWPELLPVPTVSYAVRHLRASAGGDDHRVPQSQPVQRLQGVWAGRLSDHHGDGVGGA